MALYVLRIHGDTGDIGDIGFSCHKADRYKTRGYPSSIQYSFQDERHNSCLCFHQPFLNLVLANYCILDSHHASQ